MVKVRLIDGIKFIVTLKFTSNKFVVIGDSKTDKELKVIEIDKVEALRFIEDNCGGDIGQLFELLHFDAN